MTFNGQPPSRFGREEPQTYRQKLGSQAGESLEAGGMSRSRTPALLRITCELGSKQDYLHGFVTSYVGSRFSPSTAQKLTLASYELLENALAYSSVSHQVIYELSDQGRLLEVAVSNGSVPSRIAMLTERITKLDSDAGAVYEEELRRSMTGGGRRAMLGLARVRHEAQMSVSVEVDGSLVTVRARCNR